MPVIESKFVSHSFRKNTMIVFPDDLFFSVKAAMLGKFSIASDKGSIPVF